MTRWPSLLAINTVAGVAVAVMFALVGSRRSFLNELAVSLVISHTIGTLAGLVLPRVACRLAWKRPIVSWAVVIAILLGLAVVGCLLAGLVIVSVGLVPAKYLGQLLATSLRVSAFVALGVGVGSALYGMARSQRDAAVEALRVQEVQRERAEKLAAEAQLASLESRLHPHFLFNTLNAITALIPDDPARAEALVEQLAALLRFSLDAGQRHLVPLGTELAIVRAYLDIEGARFGPRLRPRVEVSGDLESWGVPPLSLLTLVQNSVKHVAAGRTEVTEIRIHGEPDDGRLRLGVWDAGPKFSLDAAPRGHGLDTLRARLDVLYGGQARLVVEGAEGGKVVAMSLPRREPA